MGFACGLAGEGAWNAADLLRLLEFCLECGLCSASGLGAGVDRVLHPILGLWLGLAAGVVAGGGELLAVFHGCWLCGFLDWDGSIEALLEGFVLAVAFDAGLAHVVRWWWWF